MSDLSSAPAASAPAQSSSDAGTPSSGPGQNSLSGTPERKALHDTPVPDKQPTVKKPAESKKEPAKAEPKEPAAPSAEAKEAAAEEARKEAVRKYKLKANGQEVELDEAEVLKKAELGLGAYAKFEEAAKLRKDFQAVTQALKDPTKQARVLQGMGVDLNALVDQRIQELRREASMTPDERERNKLNREKEELQKEKAAWEHQQREAYVSKQTEVTKQQYATGISKALKDHGMPESGMQVSRMATTLRTLFKAGYQLNQETMAHAAQLVRNEYKTEMDSYLGSLEVPALLEMLGRDKVNAIRKHFLDQVAPKQEAAPAGDVAPKPKPPERRITTEELRQRSLNRRFGM